MLDFIKAIFNILQKTIAAWFEDRASRQAAALSYYSILSLAPLLVIIISIAGVFFGRADVQQQIITQAEEIMGTGSAELVNGILNATYNSSDGVIATLLSLGILSFAATNIFYQLKTSLNQIWNVRYEEVDNILLHGLVNMVRDRLIAAIMVIVVGFLLLASQILSTTIAIALIVAGDIPVDTASLLQLTNTVISLGLTTVIIAIIFRFLPDKQLAWSDIWIGSFFTSILLALGQRFIGLYVENAQAVSAYGVAGSLIVILLWIYFTASILLFGGEFTNAYAELYGSESKQEGDEASHAN